MHSASGAIVWTATAVGAVSSAVRATITIAARGVVTKVEILRVVHHGTTRGVASATVHHHVSTHHAALVVEVVAPALMVHLPVGGGIVLSAQGWSHACHRGHTLHAEV